MLTQDERIRAIGRQLSSAYPQLTNACIKEVLKAELEIDLQDLVDSGEVRKAEWGSFKVLQRAERTTRNPRTGQRMTVPAKKVAVFRASSRLREAVEPALAQARATASRQRAPRAKAAKGGRRRREG